AAPAGGAGDRVPDDGAALPSLWEAHSSGTTGRGAPAAVRSAPDRGDRAAEWRLSAEAGGSAATAARGMGGPGMHGGGGGRGVRGGPGIAGGGGAPGAGAECRPRAGRGGSPGRGAAGGGCEYGRDRLATGAAASLAVDGSDRRVDRVSDRSQPGWGGGGSAAR